MTEHLVICSPTGKEIPVEFWPQISELKTIAQSHGWHVDTAMMSDCSMLEQARSFIASRALERGATVTLWVDDDMLYEPQHAFELARSCRYLGMVGAIASQRKPRGLSNVNFLDPVSGRDLVFYGEGSGVAEVLSVGFGLVAVSRSVYEALDVPEVLGFDGAPMRAYFQSLIVEGQWFGEDRSFCHRVREAGEKIYIDTSVRVGHRGAYDYYLEDTMGAVPRLDRVTVRFGP